jgi:hypothetical protein
VTIFAEIHRAHLRVGHDLLRRALREHGALHQHGDLLGEAEHHIHVVLDDQHGDVGIEAGDHIEDEMALRGRHAGRRLVEQQHARPLGERNRDLDQALAAIGQLTHQLERIVDQPQRFQVIERLVDHRSLGAGRTPEIVVLAIAFADGHADVFQNRQPAEELIDLEGARQAAPGADGLAGGGDVVAIEHNTAGRRLEHAGDQVDQRRLARPVRTDQRAAGAPLERQVDVARDMQRAEAAVEAFDLQSGGHDWRPLVKTLPASSMRPMRPRRANSTASTRSRPMPNCQKVGLIFER